MIFDILQTSFFPKGFRGTTCHGTVVYNIEYKDGKIAHSAIDISKLSADTGYTPKYNFREGIAEVIDFYRKKI